MSEFCFLNLGVLNGSFTNFIATHYLLFLQNTIGKLP